MSYTSEAGYIPMTFDECMDLIRQGVNSVHSTTYTQESFVGTGHYKFYYPLVQRVQAGEIKAAEVFEKVLDFFNYVDANILGPKLTYDGLIEVFKDAGYAAGISPPDEYTKGTMRIYIDFRSDLLAEKVIQSLKYVAKKAGPEGERVTIRYTDGVSLSVDSPSGTSIIVTLVSGVTTATAIKEAIEAYPDTHAMVTVTVDADGSGTDPQVEFDADVNLEITDEDYIAEIDTIIEIIKDHTAGGIDTSGALITRTKILTNGQSFKFGFHLPVLTPTLLRLTLTQSRNNRSKILTAAEIRTKLLANIAAEYTLGKDFEPERYFTVADAPWCGDIKLEYSINDGVSWTTDIMQNTDWFLLTFAAEDISIVEA